MKRAVARRRRKRRKNLQQIGAWMLLLAVELLITAVPTALLALIFVSLAYAERGYMALGSEWLMTAAVFCITYSITHNRICDKIFEEV